MTKAEGRAAPDAVGGGLVGFAWGNSRIDQLVILALTVAAFPLLYLSLELPKIIVNDAIQGEGFPRAVFGVDLGQTAYLLALCVGFLATVGAINGLKWLMNVRVGLTGERLLRRLRYQLFEQVMRFPPERLRGARPGEVVQSILGEIEPIGGFFGEVIATPAYQGGMLLVYVGFIFAQDPLLGLAALSLYPVQAVLIPILQKRVVQLNRERAANTRRLADALSAAVGAMDDIRVNGAERWHLAQISGRLHTNTRIRKALFRRKFTIKFINNLLNQLTPFFFFSIGGAMVISGRLDIGTLVAVLAAYKDISKPWREVLNFQQRLNDFRSRFDYVAESFADGGLAPRSALDLPETPARLTGALRFERVSGGGGPTVRELAIPPGRTAAVLGDEGGPREALLRFAAGLDAPESGKVTLGGVALHGAGSAALGASVGYVGLEPALLDASVRDNILYGLMRRPAPLEGDRDAERSEMLAEARRTGGPLEDPGGDWVDLAASGCADADALRRRVTALADALGMGPELAAAALAAPLDAPGALALALAASETRAGVAEQLAAMGLTDAIEPWDRSRFIEGASLLENILFALPRTRPPEGQDPSAAALRDDAVAGALEKVGALALLEEVGADIARELAELAASVGEDSPVLDRLGGYGRADARLALSLAPAGAGMGAAARRGALERKRALRALGARFTPMRDRFDALDAGRRARALALRAACAPLIAKAPGLARFDDATPPPFITVAEMLAGGRARLDRRSAQRRLSAALEEAVARIGLSDALMEAGLGRPAGPGGVSLSAGMRRRLGVARALAKRPSLIVLNGPGGGAGGEDRALRALIRKEAPEAILLYAAADAAAAADADIIAALDADGALAADRGATEDGAAADGWGGGWGDAGARGRDDGASIEGDGR